MGLNFVRCVIIVAAIVALAGCNKNDTKVEKSQTPEADSKTALQDREPADLMDATWDSWQVDADFSDKQIMKERIIAIPVKNNNGVTNEQLSRLHNTLCDILYLFGKDDFAGYHNYLKSTGESISSEMSEVFKQNLIEYQGVAESNVPADPWERFLQYSRTNKEKSLWRGLVVQHSSIDIFEASNDKLETPGLRMKETRFGIVAYGHLTTPPITFSEMLKKEGHVRLADVTLFIGHTGEADQKVRPYVMRMWYDPVNETWRLMEVTFFPNRHERLHPSLSF